MTRSHRPLALQSMTLGALLASVVSASADCNDTPGPGLDW